MQENDPPVMAAAPMMQQSKPNMSTNQKTGEENLNDSVEEIEDLVRIQCHFDDVIDVDGCHGSILSNCPGNHGDLSVADVTYTLNDVVVMETNSDVVAKDIKPKMVARGPNFSVSKKNNKHRVTRKTNNDVISKESKKAVVAMKTNKTDVVAMETHKELHEIDALLNEVYTDEELEEIYSPRSVENIRTSFELRNSREDTDDLLRQVFKVKDVRVRSCRVTLPEITVHGY